MKWWVTIGGRVLEVEEGPEGLRVDGVPVSIPAPRAPAGGWIDVEVDGARMRALAERTPDRGWRIDEGRNDVFVRVEATGERMARLSTGRAAERSGTGSVRAPMPGRVVRVLVSEGEALSRGAPLLVLEAMKMENELRSPGGGTVDRVLVREGDAVEKGQVLITVGAEAPDAEAPDAEARS